MSENHLAENIKSLRTAYGESQLELAMSVGVESTAITNYENGDRNPKPEIRKKIASHFRITEDELLHRDFSKLRSFANDFNIKENIVKKENMVEIALLMLPVMFPILCSDDALKNENFHKAYDAHVREIDFMKAGKENSDEDLDICFDLYYDAAEKDNISEASANLLGLLLICEIKMKNPWMLKITETPNKSSSSISKLLKSFYLRDMSEDVVSLDAPENAPSEMDEIDEIIKKNLKKLKQEQDSRLSSLADYYLALRYSFGCISNGLTEDMNRTIGNEMMRTFAELGNIYAKQIILTCLKFLMGIENNKK